MQALLTLEGILISVCIGVCWTRALHGPSQNSWKQSEPPNYRILRGSLETSDLTDSTWQLLWSGVLRCMLHLFTPQATVLHALQSTQIYNDRSRSKKAVCPRRVHEVHNGAFAKGREKDSRGFPSCFRQFSFKLKEVHSLFWTSGQVLVRATHPCPGLGTMHFPASGVGPCSALGCAVTGSAFYLYYSRRPIFWAPIIQTCWIFGT